MESEIDWLVEEANKTEWRFLVKRKLGLLANSLIWNGLNSDCYKRAIGKDFEHKKGFYFEMDWHIDKKAYDKETSMIEEIDCADPQALKRFANRCYELGRELMEFTNTVSKMKHEEKTTDELIALFDEYSKKLGVFLPFLIFTHPVANYLEALSKGMIKELLANQGREDLFDEVCAVSFAPSKQNDVNLEHEAFLKLAIKARNNPSEDLTQDQLNKVQWSTERSAVLSDLHDHRKEYGWFPARDGISEPTSFEDYQIRLKDLVDSDPELMLRELVEFRKHNEETYQMFLTDLNIDDELQQKIETSKEYVFLRTYRTDRIYHSLCNMRGLLIELGKRFDLDWIHVAHMTMEEILSLNKKLPVKEEIEERISEFGYLIVDGKMHVLSGKRLENFRKGFIPAKIPELKALKGTPASRGIVVGKAKVVMDIQEIGKVEKGDVLVASMTTPDYVPAMSKAAAFVTDEGGITCHAAIIAREMKKPCVIATKFATKLLKDGDMVEVNADKGEVRILD